MIFSLSKDIYLFLFIAGSFLLWIALYVFLDFVHLMKRYDMSEFYEAEGNIP